MRTLIQRVLSASVVINGQTHSSINRGLLVLCGFEENDTSEDLEWMVQKIIQLRIFQDAEDKMNLSVKDINGEVLVISQFTLHALTKKGNRPSFIKAAKPELAIPLYEQFKEELLKKGELRVTSGVFGADMKVALINDGPVTIWMDSKNKE
jgi:D-tyrosyl-tRNA(Tyr) deacylase